MHFVSGGAYNGKANWVKEYYQLNRMAINEYEWISAYREESLPKNLTNIEKDIVILEGLERWIDPLVKDHDVETVKNKFQHIVTSWLQWEEEHARKLIIIGTDISKGIVPLEEYNRNWRDITGFIYQNIVMKSKRFTYIWYGIAQHLK